MGRGNPGEMEDVMRQSYTHLFLGKSNFRGEVTLEKIK